MHKNNKITIRELTLMSVAVSLNVVGAFIALNLRLPIYMDSIGTILIASLLGPKYAVITGVCGSLVSGMTFDPYSFYFAPTQISTGFFAAMMYKKGMLEGKKTLLGTLIFAIPTATISAIVTAYLFGGITSSGSSYIVQILNVYNVPLVVSVFLTQLATDYSDKLLAVIISSVVVKTMPSNIRLKLKAQN